MAGRAVFAEDVKLIPESVQEVYSLRCTPQILGPVYEALRNARHIVNVEMNSVTDNPIVHCDEHAILHGGNFHADYIAYAVDQLKITLVKLAMLAERRINFYLNSKSNGCLPPFLNLGKPGLTLGLQGLQFVATSTAAQSQTLAFPQYVHSISTNADNQDVVSMGTDAALISMKVARNASTVLTIEAMTLVQAVDVVRNRSRLSPASRELYECVREVSLAVREDRVLAPELEILERQLRGNERLRIRLEAS